MRMSQHVVMTVLLCGMTMGPAFVQISAPAPQSSTARITTHSTNTREVVRSITLHANIENVWR